MENANQAKQKGQEILQAATLMLAIELAFDMIQLAASVAGLYLPPIRRRDGQDHPEEAETLDEVQDWATEGIVACNAWIAANSEVE